MKEDLARFDRSGRLRFARVSEETTQSLRDAWKSIEPELPTLLDQFYQHLSSEPSLAKLLGNRIDRLKVVQTAHWKRLFSGSFDELYMQSVYMIGMVHQRIGLEPRWYIGAYQYILNAMLQVAARHDRSWGRGLPRIARAVTSAVFLDMDLAVAAYHDAMEAEKSRQVSLITGQIVDEINKGIEEINEHVLTQSASVLETQAASERIVKNLGVLNRLIEEQAANVTQSSASIEQMIATIESVTKNIDLMGSAFSRLQEASVDGETKITNVAEIMGRIAEQSEELQGANTVIKAISSQTNLLAMNAAIEAAHAGDAGRGFSVVADEIRKLAESSTGQSKEISSKIQAILTLIQTGANVSLVTKDSFKTILDQISSLAKHLGQIRGAMDEQSTGSRQILDATAQINRITTQVSGGSAEMLDGSRAISSEMQKLVTLSENVKEKTSQVLARTGTITESVVHAHQ